MVEFQPDSEGNLDRDAVEFVSKFQEDKLNLIETELAKFRALSNSGKLHNC